ncbi:MAG: type II toxin-antitoxin system HicA family toxin [bacterium]|nr:type II toxin-antitoxin system HicA family toxin [bacterium]
MGKLPQISGRDLAAVLRKEGWYEIGQRGSHLKLRKSISSLGGSTIIVPLHKTLKKGTLGAILKYANISTERLKELL